MDLELHSTVCIHLNAFLYLCSHCTCCPYLVVFFLAMSTMINDYASNKLVVPHLLITIKGIATFGKFAITFNQMPIPYIMKSKLIAMVVAYFIFL